MTDFIVQSRLSSLETFGPDHTSHASTLTPENAEDLHQAASQAARIILNQRSNLQVVWDFIKSLFGSETTATEVAKLFHDIRDNGSLEAFSALHERLRPEARFLLKLDCNKSDTTWTYSIKFGDTAIHHSTARAIGDGYEFETFDNASMLSKVSDALGQRKSKLNVDAELKDLMSTLTGLDTFSRYDKITSFVLSKTNPDDCFNSPVELHRLATDSEGRASFRLTVDGRSVHETRCYNANEQIAAIKSQIDIRVQSTLRATEDSRSLENFRAANIQCMSDSEAMQKKIVDHLDDPICRPENLVYLRDQDNAPIFKAIFRDKGGKELEFEFSTRIATNFELRSDRLKEALLKSDYSNLRDLTAQGHGTSHDVMLLYAIASLRADIENAMNQLSTDNPNVSNISLQIAKDELGKAKAIETEKFSALNSATKRVRRYTNASKTPPKDLMRQVKSTNHFYKEAKNLTETIRANIERLETNELQKLNEKALEAIKSVKLNNTTIGELLYGEAPTTEINTPAAQSSTQAITNDEMIRV